MIIFNETNHAVVYKGKFMLPGSNVVNEGDIDLENPVIKSWIEQGHLRVEESVSENVAMEAIRKANDQKIIEQVQDVAPKSENVKKAASSRKKILDDFDAEVKKAIEANKKKKEMEEA